MSHSSFETVRRAHVETLGIDVEEYVHPGTGARHFHLASDDGNNAFIVALRTVPSDSTGVAHILEHTTLCGSERFPVRDPFFMMTRRSLNTFMNAFTYPDWTGYPFATQNRKDFDNLLDVYLDAVFFPKLEELDFMQEGHRLEPGDPDDPGSPLVLKGVVYNEMKGAMSQPTGRLWQEIQTSLYPTTTYHHNFGGDPAHIPDLGWQDLRDFHAHHYHPSNAVFMTYGSFPVEEHQARLEERVLSRFERQDPPAEIHDERRYESPVARETTYPIAAGEDASEKTHVILGWLLGRSIDLDEVMNAHLLTGVLLDHSASPLRLALETTDLGKAPSPLAGLDDGAREAAFVCGLEGTEPDRAEAVERLVLDVLGDVASKGVERSHVESVLHQLELSQREVGGGRFPYGLQLSVRALPSILHGGDPVAFLDIDPTLLRLREDIRDEGFVPTLTRRLLIDNPHRVRLTMSPDPEMAAREAEEERQRVARLEERMSDEERRAIHERTRALKQRQETPDDPEILPRVGREDVPPDIPIPQPVDSRVDRRPAAWFPAATNGLVYAQVVLDLPPLDDDLVDALPFFSSCLTEVGSGGRDYIETQVLQASVTGGVSSRASVRSATDDLTRVRGVWMLGGKALARNSPALAKLMRETWSTPRLDELSRLRELSAQARAARRQAVTGSGHALAMIAASAGFAPCGALSHRWGGLAGLKKLEAMDETLDSGGMDDLVGKLERLAEAVTSSSPRLVLVAEASSRELLESSFDGYSRGLARDRDDRFVLPAPGEVPRQAWTTSTQVSFCAKAYPTVPVDHPDAAALSVLGPFIRNNFLHRAVREQGGAYGAGAGWESDSGAFRFFSYRDPRLAETLEDFDRSIAWLLESRHEERILEEAILGVVSDLDRPESPAGECLKAFHATLHGRTPEKRRAHRQRVLEVTIGDLQRVAREHLTAERAGVAVVTSKQILSDQPDLDLEVIEI